MARTKLTRRTYKLGNPQQTENSREAERLLVEELGQGPGTKPSDQTEIEQEDLPNAFMDSPSVKDQGVAFHSEVEDMSNNGNTSKILSNPKENGLDTFPKLQENGLEMFPIPEENGLDMPTNPQEKGIDISPRPQENGLDMSLKLQDNGSDICAKLRENGTDLSSKPQESGFHTFIKPQENGLDLSPKLKENGLDLSPKSKENGLDLSPKLKINGLDLSPKLKISALDLSPKRKENGLDTNDDSLEWKSPILRCSQRKAFSRSQVKRSQVSPVLMCGQGNISNSQEPSNSQDDVDTYISRDLPLNLTWDSSMKGNAELQANSPQRPVTPDLMRIPVDEIFSPNTQKEIRTSIRALFPNGPPPPPAVRPMRRPKKGDDPYIVGCTKRPRVPSPTSLTVFQGDNYGITNNSNYAQDEEQCLPAKRGHRGPNGSASLSKSRFNPQSNEIAERLKLHEKIDRLLGRAPKDEPISYMTKPRSFSPLPSTSTDNETIMKNDRYFSESLNCDNFDIDDDEELPEILWDTSSHRQEIKREDTPLALDKVLNEDKKKNTDNISMDVNEDTNNNNNNDIISIDDDFSEIEFDKFMPKEKILDYSDVEVVKPTQGPEVIDTIDLKDTYHPVQMRVNSPRTNTDVICIDDAFNQGTSANENVLRVSNKNAQSTETKQSDLVIEVPDVIEPVNMTRQASARPVWNPDVQFVSELRTNERPPDENVENSTDVQIIQGPSGSQSTRLSLNLSSEFLNALSESYPRRKSRLSKKKSKRQKSKENKDTAVVNNENTAPSVNQGLVSAAGQPPATPPSAGKSLGQCPICLDNFPTGSIASTNCGHVFCLECIKQSLKTSGRKCPTCRKQLRGVGYHQVFL